jgi:hypothetical protein
MNYDGRTFRPVLNTPNGEVNGATEFQYRQVDDLFEATYQGGGVRSGQMVGRVLEGGRLEFLYQHLTDAGQLRHGHCLSIPELLPDGRLRLHETWQWANGDRSEGTSIVEEVA